MLAYAPTPTHTLHLAPAVPIHPAFKARPPPVPPSFPLCRHLRKLLVELLAIARATRGKEELALDLSPVGEDFDPEAEL